MHDVWIDAEGCRLFAADGGSGSALLVVHGGLASHEAVLPIVEPLTDRYRVIAPDLRGSGRSHCSEALTFDRFADDLVRILDHLGIGRAFIGGISSGSGVAVGFALRHPKRTRGLIVLKPIYGGEEMGYTQGQAQQHPPEISDIYERCLQNCVVLPATTEDLATAVEDFCGGVIKGRASRAERFT